MRVQDFTKQISKKEFTRLNVMIVIVFLKIKRSMVI